ncbi:MAG: hypothetical protein AAF975_04855 [Spirochaetota bacterium]
MEAQLKKPEIVALIRFEISSYMREHERDTLSQYKDVLERIYRVESELKAQRESFTNEFKVVHAELKAQREVLQMHIEQTEKRFEQVDKRFEQMQHNMDKRFEQVDKRFEQMQHNMDKRFEQVDKRFEQVDKRLVFQQWLISGGTALIIGLMTLYQYLG